jgi:ADP-ribosylglycohydrolase
LCDPSLHADAAFQEALVKNMQAMGRKYPDGGYGGMFAQWLLSDHPHPYYSFGNGSAMRVSPAAWFAVSLKEALHLAKISAEVTHNHPEGIKGAQAVAACIFLARAHTSKEEIRKDVEEKSGYDLSRSLDKIRPCYTFDETCPGSVPEAITAFLEGENYEDTIRKAICLGGDSDTIACMAGGIAEAYYGMPAFFKEQALARLDPACRKIVRKFKEACFIHQKGMSQKQAGNPLRTLE